MEDPPVAIHAPHNSEKRMFSGSGSSSSSKFVDPDVIEIPPPATWKPKRLKQNSIVGREVIVVDDEDSDDIIIIDEKVAPNSKGKKPMHHYFDVPNLSASNGDRSPQANGFIKGELSSSAIEDNYLFDDDCAMLQAHFDSVDIPSGIEATVPWWPASAGGEKNSMPASSSSVFGAQPYSSIGISEMDQFLHPWSVHKHLQANNYLPKSIGQNFEFPLSGDQTNSGFHMEPSSVIPPKPQWPLAPGHSYKKRTNSNSQKLPKFGMKSFSGWKNASQGNASPMMGGDLSATSLPSAFISGFAQYGSDSIGLDDGITAGISPPSTDGQGETSETHILKKLELFQSFDSVEDHSDHRYNIQKGSYNQPNSWKKKIFAEWDMLKKDLPDTIFVRIYEARMDLLRAVIMGADGTPYHDGLFFFDVYFAPEYPAVPPLVNYHAHGLRINPNLYNCGKVCLSLLGTWSGRGSENWRPGKSTMLQVLVSIQGLILNAEPYYNEPGFAHSKNTSQSKDYSENTFLLSLKTMLYTMNNPPKHFEDLVFGHFYKRAHDILAACRAYLDGVQVGSFVKGKSHVAQTTGKTCSHKLKASLPGYIKTLVAAFTKIGVKDCDKFLVPVDNNAYQSAGSSRRSYYKSKY